jgi:hypothetical protein
VLRAQNLDRFLRRHRRATALVGTLIVLGVAGLNAHDALPEHHDHRGVATMCIAALSIATLAAFAWGARRGSMNLTPPLRSPRSTTPLCGFDRDVVTIVARAGPPGPVVLRR